MSSSAVSSNLSRILVGSLIGAVIGLVLLALGVAILWKAADQRLTETTPPAAVTPVSAPLPSQPPKESRASPVPYPVVPSAGLAPRVEAEVRLPEARPRSVVSSIFDDDDEADAPPASAPAKARPQAAPSRPAPSSVAPGAQRPPRAPPTRRAPPEARRQEDSLFF
ncbi:hypothetical protein ACFPIF_12820 [Brevundimonas faecalis]|uniref:hypothetical protein n=1 Tax=Brevundimonas faecalis TaxID=947378 RepID=UPI003617563D